MRYSDEQLLAFYRELQSMNYFDNGILIVVGVALDTMAQIEGYLMNHHYEGFLGSKTKRLKSRRG